MQPLSSAVRVRPLRWLAAAFLVLACVSPAQAQVPAGYSEYYIPGDEDNLSLALCTHGGAACTSTATHSVISVTGWADTTAVYYDHWENGYNFDPANPTTADETYNLNTGQRLVFESATITLPRTATPPTGSTCTKLRNGAAATTTPNLAYVCYDGRDRIYTAGGPVTVARVGWNQTRGVGVQGAAWEIYPVKPQLTAYIFPFGENIQSGETAIWFGFQRVAALVQATADNTTITIDVNGDGAPDLINANRNATKSGADGDTTTVILNKGQSFLLDQVSACRLNTTTCTTNPGTLNTGTVIQGTSTLQVKYITGRTDVNYCTRGFSAFPRGFWTSDYYAPLDQPTDTANGITDYYLYNPNSASITVDWQGLATSGSFAVPAASALSFRTATGGNVPAGSGLYFRERNGNVFWGVGSNDALDWAHEWGFSLLPSTMLFEEHFLGWAPDAYPPAAGETDMGAFLSVAQDNTTVFVDYDNNGTTDQTYTLNRLQTQYVVNPTTGDLSGAHFWGTGPFTLAYGQNGNTASTTAPALDLGYVAIPGTDFISLVLGVNKSVSPQVVPTASGSTATFTLTVSSQKYTVDGVNVTDYMPPNWQYVNDSAVIVRPDKTSISGGTANPTVTGVPATGQTLAWSTTQVGNATAPSMLQNQEMTITFTGQTTAAFTAGTLSQNRVTAVGTRTVGGVTQTFTAKNFAYVTYGDLQIAKTSNAATPLYPGDRFSYTVNVRNTSPTNGLTSVSLYDALPPGLIAVPSTTSVAVSATSRDLFGTASYANDNGNAAWDGAWVESDSGGGGATGGRILVTGGELRINNQDDRATQSITRGVNLSGTGATQATLRFDYRTSGTLEAADVLVVQYRTGGAGGFTTFTAGTFTDDVSGTATFAIPVASPANLTEVRFAILSTAAYGSNGEFFYVDNLSLAFNRVAAGGDAPDLLSGYSLPAAETLTATFDVTVENPLPSGITSITNTASTTSAQFPIALTASVTNIVANPSVLSASVGGRVWLDADFDATQDPGEPGIANVEVTLKDRFGTPVATGATDLNGRYLFPGVEPGTGYYVEVTDRLPGGLSQTFPAGQTNNRTTTFDLAAGQAYGSADVGYRSASDKVALGDLVWVDPNANGLRDSGEIGLGGVTVRLYQDDGDGRFDETLDTLLATTTSAPDGSYLFTNRTAGLSYIVTATAPFTPGAPEYAPTTAGSFVFPNATAGAAYLTADMGFRGDTIATYTLSDRVWLDTGNFGVYDAGSEFGIAGVTVSLLDRSLNVIGTTVTAADGTFTFSGLAGSNADYTVRLTDSTGVLTNYFGTTTYAQARQRAESNVVASVDRRADPSYGFRATRAIGDTVYFDINGNGTQDAGENGIAGARVRLYRDTGTIGRIDNDQNGTIDETQVGGEVLTDANGRYLFAGLTDGNYVVSVVGPAGYTAIGSDQDAATAGVQRAYTMAGTNIDTADFGFQAPAGSSRTISGVVWSNDDGDAVVDTDPAEAGLAGVTVQILSGSNPLTAILVATLTTDANGAYSLSGLLAGTYIVRVTDTNGALAGYTPNYEKTAGPFDYLEVVDASAGDVTDVNFGYVRPVPTHAAIASVTAYLAAGAVTVEWRTSLEVGTVGFHLLRLDPDSGQYVRVTDRLLPALFVHPQGGVYRFVDAGAPTEGTLTYQLVEIDMRGRARFYGPYEVSVSPAAPRALDERVARDLESRSFSRRAVGPTRARLDLRATVSSERKVAALRRLKRQGRVLKVTTREAGIHFLSAAEMAVPLGMPAERVAGLIRAGRLTLSHLGRAVPHLPDSQGTGTWFYAEAVASPYTDENAYWMSVTPGPTMKAWPAPAGGLLVTSFTETVHREQEQYALPVYFRDPEQDFWAWEYLYAGYDGLDVKSFAIRADGVAGYGAASLTVHLMGGSDSAPGDDHHVQILLNGRPVGEARWDGVRPFDIEFPLATGSVLEGTNVVELRAVLGPGVPESLLYVDSFDLTYERRYEAVDDALSFTAASGTGVAVSGFTRPEVMVFDVTVPSRPVLVTPGAISESGDGRYEVRFTATGRDEVRRYEALLPGRAKSPTAVAAWVDAGLRREANAADYLLVAPESLMDAAQSLAEYRRSRGLATMVVGIDDIYDEFNAGIAEPAAIRAFLRHATSRWSTAPRYVTLVGRGTYDYRNIEGFGDNLVPTQLVGTPDGLVASDVALADLSGDDGIPEIAIGRLPVVTAADVADYLAKIQAHESAASGEWQRRVLLTADNADVAGNFPADSDSLAALLPSEYAASRVDLTTTSGPAGRQAILQAVNDGVVAFNYIGHGGPDRLAQENLFTTPDVAALDNSDRLPVFLAMTCSAGNFAFPGYPSLGEAMLLRKGGGAFAVWAPSGLSENPSAVRLDQSFFRGAFVDGEKVLGDLVVRSLGELDTPGTGYMRYMYNLIGEPVSRLPE